MNHPHRLLRKADALPDSSTPPALFLWRHKQLLKHCLLKASSAPGFVFKILRRLAVLFMPSLPECQLLVAQSYADEALLASLSPTFTKFFVIFWL